MVCLIRGPHFAAIHALTEYIGIEILAHFAA